MAYKVKCCKCGKINKVRKWRNHPMYIEKCECGHVSSIKPEVFDGNQGEVVSFVLIGNLSWSN